MGELRVLAVTLALTSSIAFAQTVESAVPAAETAAPEADIRAGWRHDFSVAWHMATFTSKESSQYTLHSVALSYLMSVNATGPFFHLSFYFPVQARQDGIVHSVSSIYEGGGGFDLLLGWQWRFVLGREVEFEAGPGVHANAFNLDGKPGLANFNGIQLGAGGMAILRWRPGWKPGRVGWSVGAMAATAIDVYDPLRSNDLSIGFVLRMGGFVGVDLP
jgi:opacity protein-like surface antigen